MTVRVIREGNEHKDKWGRWECCRCKSLLVSSTSDGKQSTSPKNECFIVTACPVCGEKNYVEIEKFQFDFDLDGPLPPRLDT
jgi:RNase P subunit RPR2